jgi:hypothetical protein
MLRLSQTITATFVSVGILLGFAVVTKHAAEWLLETAPALLFGLVATGLITALILARK